MSTQEWLGRLNSASKYPSIETYHELDPRTGKLFPTVDCNGFGGIVLRDPDRRVIAKARFKDYERALAPTTIRRPGDRGTSGARI